MNDQHHKEVQQEIEDWGLNEVVYRINYVYGTPSWTRSWLTIIIALLLVKKEKKDEEWQKKDSEAQQSPSTVKMKKSALWKIGAKTPLYNMLKIENIVWYLLVFSI